MDGCTRHRVSYLAINVQFINSKNMVDIKTLAVCDTQAQHSSELLRDTLETVLKEFNLKKQQVLAIVTDNASNMARSVEKFNEVDVLPEVEADEDSSALDEVFGSALSRMVGFSSTTHMRCAMHTLQLAIRDGLKEKHVNRLVSKVCHVAITARTLKIDVMRLLELKECLLDLAHLDLTLTDCQWNEVKQLEELLRHPFRATKQMQSAHLTTGSFYKEWKTLIFKLSHVGGKVADAIRASMQHRETKLMNNDVLLSAIYIYPKYRITLNKDQLEREKRALVNIAINMHNFSKRNKTCENTTFLPSVSETSSTTSLSDDELDFEKQLDM